MSTISTAYIEKAYSYEQYRSMVDQLLSQGKTTGPDQSGAFIHYTELNQQRIHRLEKTLMILPSVEMQIKAITTPQIWLVLTEAWCGDAAQSLPVMHGLALLNPLIELRLLLRDENLELMDRYLTNGVSRSIPKLIGLNATTREELFVWGSRPAELQAYFARLRSEGLDHHVITESLQRWYNKDKTESIQWELATLASGQPLNPAASTKYP